MSIRDNLIANLNKAKGNSKDITREQRQRAIIENYVFLKEIKSNKKEEEITEAEIRTKADELMKDGFAARYLLPSGTVQNTISEMLGEKKISDTDVVERFDLLIENAHNPVDYEAEFEKLYADKEPSQKAEAKQKYLTACKVNEAVRFGNPKAVMTPEQVFDVCFNDAAKELHDKAVEQKAKIDKQKDAAAKINLQNKAPAKFNGLYQYALKNDGSFEDQIEKNKMETYLGGDTKEAADYEHGLAVKIINKALSVPDSELAKTGDAAKDALADNFGEIQILINLSKICGPNLNRGICIELNLPQNAKDALQHKIKLTLQNQDLKENQIDEMAKDNYENAHILSKLNKEELTNAYASEPAKELENAQLTQKQEVPAAQVQDVKPEVKPTMSVIEEKVGEEDEPVDINQVIDLDEIPDDDNKVVVPVEGEDKVIDLDDDEDIVVAPIEEAEEKEPEERMVEEDSPVVPSAEEVAEEPAQEPVAVDINAVEPEIQDINAAFPQFEDINAVDPEIQEELKDDIELEMDEDDRPQFVKAEEERILDGNNVIDLDEVPDDDKVILNVEGEDKVIDLDDDEEIQEELKDDIELEMDEDDKPQFGMVEDADNLKDDIELEMDDDDRAEFEKTEYTPLDEQHDMVADDDGTFVKVPESYVQLPPEEDNLKIDEEIKAQNLKAQEQAYAAEEDIFAPKHHESAKKEISEFASLVKNVKAGAKAAENKNPEIPSDAFDGIQLDPLTVQTNLEPRKDKLDFLIDSVTTGSGVDKFYVKSSTEFRKMKSTLTAMPEALKKCTNVNQKLQLMNELKQKTEDYLAYKDPDNLRNDGDPKFYNRRFSEYERSRIDFAEEIDDYVEKQIAQCQTELKNQKIQSTINQTNLTNIYKKYNDIVLGQAKSNTDALPDSAELLRDAKLVEGISKQYGADNPVQVACASAIKTIGQAYSNSVGMKGLTDAQVKADPNFGEIAKIHNELSAKGDKVAASIGKIAEAPEASKEDIKALGDKKNDVPLMM